MNKNKLRNYVMLIFNITVSVFPLIHTSDALAGSITSKEQDQHHANPYITKGKFSNNYDDVWKRIRLGMKITAPGLMQASSKQTLIPEQNNLAPTIPTGNILPEQPVKSKYIIQPHTAITPLNNYTDLGFRLKFGTPRSSSLPDNCIPTLSTQIQQKRTSQSKNNSSANPQLHQHTLLTSYGNNIPQTTLETPESYTQTTNNLTPCTKHIDRLNTSGKQRDMAGQKNTKKATINERINKHIAFFSGNPEYLYRVTERAHPYLYHIVEALSKNHLPLELALLPMVESAYQPTALSPKGAAGLWQFIPSTGKDYDLKQSNQYDERLDILASTQAAIRFLSDLKNHFNGDWLLALAAYNCGQGAVDDAIRRNLSDGLDTNFWSLHLPEETQEYVPRLLALSHIFANPDIYGLKFAPIKNEPYFVKVKIDREPDIKYLANKNFALLAKLVNLTHEQFKSLNPGYLNSTLSTKKEYIFLLPIKNIDQLHRLLTSITQFMAEPVSQTMKEALKPTITDLNQPILTSIRL